MFLIIDAIDRRNVMYLKPVYLYRDKNIDGYRNYID